MSQSHIPVRGSGRASKFKPIKGKEALVDFLTSLGFKVITDAEEVELFDDEWVVAERVIATGVIDSVDLLVDCYPWQCRVSTPIYLIESCHCAPVTEEVKRCIDTIVAKGKAFELTLQDLKTLLARELPGFEVQTFAGGVDGYHDVVEQGVIKVFKVRLTHNESILQVHVKAKDPKLIVELAKTLTGIIRQGGG